jgi:hypothetical protein
MKRLNLIGITITVAALLLLNLLLAGCEQASVILTPQNNENKVNKIVGFELKQATLTVNGKTLMENLNLEDESFFIFYVYLKEGGLFVISVEPFSLAVEAGNFMGNLLQVNLNDFRIEVNTQSENILNDGVDQLAWVIHIPEFPMFAPGVKPADFVVGIAGDFNQIPGFNRN